MATETLTIGTILFEGTLFIIFVYFISLIFKQHVLPAIKQQIIDAKKYLVDLTNKKKLLITQHENLDDQLSTQEKKLRLLNSKMKKWHQNLVRTHEESVKKRKRLLEKIAKRKTEQAHNFVVQKMQQLVIPQAVAAARQNILTSFDDTKKKEMLDKVVDSL